MNLIFQYIHKNFTNNIENNWEVIHINYTHNLPISQQKLTKELKQSEMLMTYYKFNSPIYTRKNNP